MSITVLKYLNLTTRSIKQGIVALELNTKIFNIQLEESILIKLDIYHLF